MLVVFISLQQRLRLCKSRNYPYLPHGRLMVIPRERGLVKANVFEEKYGAILEFPEGWRL